MANGDEVVTTASQAVGDANDNLAVTAIRPPMAPPGFAQAPRLYVQVWQRMPALGVRMLTAMREVW